MKKFLAILVLGLMWCNTSFAIPKEWKDLGMGNRKVDYNFRCKFEDKIQYIGFIKWADPNFPDVISLLPLDYDEKKKMYGLLPQGFVKKISGADKIKEAYIWNEFYSGVKFIISRALLTKRDGTFELVDLWYNLTDEETKSLSADKDELQDLEPKSTADLTPEKAQTYMIAVSFFSSNLQDIVKSKNNDDLKLRESYNCKNF